MLVITPFRYYHSGSNETIVDEQLQLERKLYDLYSKKEQMASLVDELQLMNEVAQRSLVSIATPIFHIDADGASAYSSKGNVNQFVFPFSRIEIRYQFEMYPLSMSGLFQLS